MSYEKGTRVGALLGSDQTTKTVQWLGFGVYEGDFPYGQDGPEPVGDVADLGRLVHGGAFPNPRIRLDSGKVVWGCECWWGPEERMKKELESYRASGWTVTDVDIDAMRAEAQAARETGA